jgi:nitrite reductase (NO-forming)
VIPQRIANGMYGLVIVEPKDGLPQVDKEFYVMQGDMYTLGDNGEPGLQEFSLNKMVEEDADYVVFNGSVGAITGPNALRASVGETVRSYFGVGGSNLTSSFHVIGEIFDEVHQEGAMEAAHNVQTTLVPASGATGIDFEVDVPGTYLLVDHSLGRFLKGAAGHLTVEGDTNAHIFHKGS